MVINPLVSTLVSTLNVILGDDKLCVSDTLYRLVKLNECLAIKVFIC